MQKKQIIKYLKSEGYEDKPQYITAYQFSLILHGLKADFYIETLGTSVGEGEQTPYLDYYEPLVNAIILMDDVEWQYKVENLGEIADWIIDWEQLYNTYKAKFLPLKDK